MLSEQGVQYYLVQNVCMESKGQNNTLYMCRMIQICKFGASSKALFHLTFQHENQRKKQRSWVTYLGPFVYIWGNHSKSSLHSHLNEGTDLWCTENEKKKKKKKSLTLSTLGEILGRGHFKASF